METMKGMACRRTSAKQAASSGRKSRTITLMWSHATRGVRAVPPNIPAGTGGRSGAWGTIAP
ncbi:hypothetical protein GCM10023083_30710 [Streptomyces phyllanthi]